VDAAGGRTGAAAILGFAVVEDKCFVAFFKQLLNANPTLSATIQQDSIPIGSMMQEFLEYGPHDISPHSPLTIVLHGSLMDANC